MRTEGGWDYYDWTDGCNIPVGPGDEFQWSGRDYWTKFTGAGDIDLGNRNNKGLIIRKNSSLPSESIHFL